MGDVINDVVVEDRGAVRVLRLNRPDLRNALRVPTLVQLQSLLDACEHDSAIRCLVLAGTGRSFCAGADVTEWAEAEARGELETYGWTETAHALVARLAAFPKPTVAAINGSAVGAGVDLALACDFRLAAESASLRCGYTGMAYNPDMGSTWFLPRLIGVEAAKRFVFLNERWAAADALRVGLVGHVAPDDGVVAAACDLAVRLAAGPTVALGHAKRLIALAHRQDLVTQLEQEQDAGKRCGRTEDAREALRASEQKRAPVFVGR